MTFLPDLRVLTVAALFSSSALANDDPRRALCEGLFPKEEVHLYTVMSAIVPDEETLNRIITAKVCVKLSEMMNDQGRMAVAAGALGQPMIASNMLMTTAYTYRDQLMSTNALTGETAEHLIFRNSLDEFTRERLSYLQQMYGDAGTAAEKRSLAEQIEGTCIRLAIGAANVMTGSESIDVGRAHGALVAPFRDLTFHEGGLEPASEEDIAALETVLGGPAWEGEALTLARYRSSCIDLPRGRQSQPPTPFDLSPRLDCYYLKKHLVGLNSYYEAYFMYRPYPEGTDWGDQAREWERALGFGKEETPFSPINGMTCSYGRKNHEKFNELTLTCRGRVASFLKSEAERVSASRAVLDSVYKCHPESGDSWSIDELHMGSLLGDDGAFLDQIRNHSVGRNADSRYAPGGDGSPAYSIAMTSWMRGSERVDNYRSLATSVHFIENLGTAVITLQFGAGTSLRKFE